MHLLACTVCTWRSSECFCLETFVSDLRVLLCSDFMLPILYFGIVRKTCANNALLFPNTLKFPPFASCFCSMFVKRTCLLCTGVRLNVNAFCISYCVFQHAGTRAALQQASLFFIYGKTRLKKTGACKSESRGSVKLCSHELVISLPPVCKPVSNLVIYT